METPKLFIGFNVPEKLAALERNANLHTERERIHIKTFSQPVLSLQKKSGYQFLWINLSNSEKYEKKFNKLP
jgi:hypothetical protein